MDLAHLSTNRLCSLLFTHFTISPSTSSVWIHIALPTPIMTGSSASSPNTKPEPLQGQCCYNANSGLSGSSSASVLLPMPHRRQRSSHVSASCKGFEIVRDVSCHTGIRHIEHELDNASGFVRFCSSQLASGSPTTRQDAFKMKSTFWPF